MASPQPTDAHGIIAHDIQENILIRDFSKQQLKIIYLVIRLSWGCDSKAWQYNSYKDFEVIGLHKSDVASNLEYLHNNKVIEWIEKYKLIIFKKDYDQWIIPKKVDRKTVANLVHKSLLNTNEVRNLLTVLGKNANGVSGKSEQLWSGTPECSGIRRQSKENIKESNNIYSVDFEKFWNIYPRKIRKKDANKSWNKLIKKKVDANLLINCATNYVNECNNREEKFIMHPCTFLNNERYIDYMPKEKKKPSQVLIEPVICVPNSVFEG